MSRFMDASNSCTRAEPRNWGIHPLSLCLETQGREIMAVLVQHVVAEAMSLNLYGEPAKRVNAANGVALRRGDNKVQNG